MFFRWKFKISEGVDNHLKMILSATETNSNIANNDHYINCPWFNIGIFWVSSAFYAPKTIHNKEACLVFTVDEALRVTKLFMAFGRSKSDCQKKIK